MPDSPNHRSDRPWGSFFVLEDLPYTKVKRLVVNPGQRVSLQSHKLRNEHWIVVRGVARVTLDETTADYQYGDHIYVCRGARHRIACVGQQPVEVIEVQTGESFAEEDISRYADDYHRV